MKNKKEKVCKLTGHQKHLWEKYYSMCLNNGMNEEDADKETKFALIKDFPLLKGCDKFK